jgi:membrane-bound lytic murein transglycosylase F
MVAKRLTYALLIGALVYALILVGCDGSWVRNDLEAIKARGELVLVTRNNFSCYFEASHGPAGFEYELAKAFADHLGVRLRIVVTDDEADMVEALLKGKADLALGPGYLDVREQVVGRRGGPVINSVKDLVQHPLWISGSSASLEQLKRLKAKYHALSWQVLSDYSSEELLQMVWNRSVPLTVIDSNTLTMNRRFYPELVVDLNLGGTQRLRWAINPLNHHLQRAVRRWFAAKSTQKTVAGLINLYYSHLEEFDYVDLARYRRSIFERLPKFKDYFEEAARHYGLDWELIAAQAYQESHWNPHAKSFSGVRGIMMLTQETAKALGLKNRMSEKETIFAGTRYMARLRRLIGDEVPEPDRTLMALAAYNVGFGHLQDARSLAQKIGKPSNSWSGVRETLPMLQQKKYYRKLPHGYARGTEAVQYVDRIRTYHKVLTMALAPDGSGFGG